NGKGKSETDELPDSVIPIDEYLLSRKHVCNSGLLGTWKILAPIFGGGCKSTPYKIYRRLIAGSWIYGMIKCTKTEDDYYKSGECVLMSLYEEGTNSESRLYSRMEERDDDPQHETVNNNKSPVSS
ncbi:hypothetical protein HZS_4579, partial [Henneguya salminicola]